MGMSSRSPFGRMSGMHGLADVSLKQLIAWGDHLKVDQPQIDAQHEAIFNIAVEISDTWHKHGDVDQLIALADKLHKVLDAHFRYEEGQLAEVGYPKLAQHKAEHKGMLDELQSIRDRLAGMGHGTVQMEPGSLLLNYILGVTVGHICHSDMEYCVFARRAAEDKGQVWPAR